MYYYSRLRLRKGFLFLPEEDIIIFVVGNIFTGVSVYEICEGMYKQP